MSKSIYLNNFLLSSDPISWPAGLEVSIYCYTPCGTSKFHKVRLFLLTKTKAFLFLKMYVCLVCFSMIYWNIFPKGWVMCSAGCFAIIFRYLISDWYNKTAVNQKFVDYIFYVYSNPQYIILHIVYKQSLWILKIQIPSKSLHLSSFSVYGFSSDISHLQSTSCSLK